MATQTKAKPTHWLVEVHAIAHPARSDFRGYVAGETDPDSGIFTFEPTKGDFKRALQFDKDGAEGTARHLTEMVEDGAGDEGDEAEYLFRPVPLPDRIPKSNDHLSFDRLKQLIKGGALS